jgi:hypothetical protein
MVDYKAAEGASSPMHHTATPEIERILTVVIMFCAEETLFTRIGISNARTKGAYPSYLFSKIFMFFSTGTANCGRLWSLEH